MIGINLLGGFFFRKSEEKKRWRWYILSSFLSFHMTVISHSPWILWYAYRWVWNSVLNMPFSSVPANSGMRYFIFSFHLAFFYSHPMLLVMLIWQKLNLCKPGSWVCSFCALHLCSFCGFIFFFRREELRKEWSCFSPLFSEGKLNNNHGSTL